MRIGRPVSNAKWTIQDFENAVMNDITDELENIELEGDVLECLKEYNIVFKVWASKNNITEKFGTCVSASREMIKEVK